MENAYSVVHVVMRMGKGLKVVMEEVLEDPCVCNWASRSHPSKLTYPPAGCQGKMHKNARCT